MIAEPWPMRPSATQRPSTHRQPVVLSDTYGVPLFVEVDPRGATDREVAAFLEDLYGVPLVRKGLKPRHEGAQVWGQ